MSDRKLNSLAGDYLQRLKDAVSSTSAFGRLSFWIEEHTTLAGRPYSFKGHEYQRAILDSKHPNQVTIKPSQVGATELSSRLALAFVAVSRSLVALYLLPTVGEAQRFAKSRLDDIIAGSKYMRENIAAGSDSSSFKKIGTSQCFIHGTFGRAVISIPASLLVIDERDFCNQENCKTAESRLSHSPIYNERLDVRGIRRNLSTPTVPNYGVSGLYEKSNQQKRLCKCNSCKEWFWPSYFDIVIPGHEVNLREATATELSVLESQGKIDTAVLLCPNCHNIVTKDNLQHPSREWVAERPSEHLIEGFAITPFDLPDYHTPQSLLRKRIEYEDEVGHFYNFTLGIPYADSSNSVLPGVVRENTVLNPSYPDSNTISGTVMGLDVGKTSWLTVAKPFRVNGEVELHVIWLEQIRINANDEESLVATVAQRIKQFKCVRCVVDAMPYTSDMIRLQGLFPEGLVLLNSYVLTDRKLPNFIVDEKTFEVKSHRTKVIDACVKAVNTSKVKFPIHPDIMTLDKHLQGMKRVDRLNDKAEMESSWQKVGADHYMHSLTYCHMASSMVAAGMLIEFSIPTTIKEAFVGRNFQRKTA